MLKGMIILWSGAVVDIPDDWALCDGDNGTPNLKNKFVIGTSILNPVDSTGGSINHNHAFTGDGHWHDHSAGAGLASGAGFLQVTSLKPATGLTDNADSRPPFYALAYIMKLHDDPDPRLDLPWPYAAKAIIQHTHQNSILQIWVTFRFKMNVGDKPADNLWLVECDGVPEAITASAWQDQWTMLLTIDPLVGAPAEVTVEYDGPDENLTTVWDKQWEPWGPIVSVEIPTPPETKTLATGPADQDAVDVSGTGTLFLNCSATDIVIGGFIGGVNGQVLHIARLCATANDGTIRHDKATGNQKILLHAGADETIFTEYGGWALACNGTNWYDISHAKHV